MSTEEIPNIEPTDPSKILEKEKLELEIKELRTSYFKKTIAPILVQAGVGLTIALISIYLVYKNNLFDVREKNIDAKTKYNETLLKTIELTQKRELLDGQVREFEAQRKKMLEDSMIISSRLDSMSEGYNNMTINYNGMLIEKSSLQRNIEDLAKNKITLTNELSFAVTNKNLQDLKLFPSPYYKFTNDLILLLKSNNPFRQRVIDSLLLYTTDDNKYRCISLYVLYKGTSNTVYKKTLFSEIERILKPSKTFENGRCLNLDFRDILSDSSWNFEEKNELAKIFMRSYNKVGSICIKIDLLYIIRVFGADNFPFSTQNYNLYWDYLKLNRDIAFSTDTVYSGEDKRVVLSNIIVYSPQLFFAILIKHLGKEESLMLGGNSTSTGIVKALLDVDYLPAYKYNYFYDFEEKNKINSLNKNEEKKYNSDLMDKYKSELENWLEGNFELFRNNPGEYNKRVNNKTF